MAGRKVAQPNEFEQHWKLIRFLSRFSAGMFPSREEIQLWMQADPTDLINEMIRVDIITPVIVMHKPKGPSTFAGFRLTERGMGIAKDFSDVERAEYNRRRKQHASDCRTVPGRGARPGPLEFGAGGKAHRRQRKPPGD